jgi:hypothetical protein
MLEPGTARLLSGSEVHRTGGTLLAFPATSPSIPVLAQGAAGRRPALRDRLRRTTSIASSTGAARRKSSRALRELGEEDLRALRDALCIGSRPARPRRRSAPATS